MELGSDVKVSNLRAVAEVLGLKAELVPVEGVGGFWLQQRSSDYLRACHLTHSEMLLFSGSQGELFDEGVGDRLAWGEGDAGFGGLEAGRGNVVGV